MFDMNILSHKFACKIVKELELDKESGEIIAYGTFAIIQTFFSIMLVVIFGAIFNVLVEALIISFAASILRKSSGGAHATTPQACAIIGTIICIIFAKMLKLIPELNLIYIVIVGVIVFFWSYYMLYRLAPVDSLAKPIKKQEKRNKLKRKSINILSIYLIIVIAILAFYNYKIEKNILIYTLCIYFGIAWQIFTLTHMGHATINKLDTFLNSIIEKGGELYEKS